MDPKETCNWCHKYKPLCLPAGKKTHYQCTEGRSEHFGKHFEDSTEQPKCIYFEMRVLSNAAITNKEVIS